MARSDRRPQAFRPVPRTGVIYVMGEAARCGYTPSSPEWSNLGQGMPETGALPGGPPRVDHVDVDPADLEYAPIAGIWELREAVAELYNSLHGRGAVLASNPANPTGRVVAGAELQGWVDAARELECCLILDEFYSHYVWEGPGAPVMSAAACIEDVDHDPVLILDGLTKNWRYPGWRVSWILGPRDVIEAVSSAGSFLDGGGSRPLQRAALPLLSPERTRAE